MTPQLQQAIKLLQLNQLELVNLVEQEMQENPVLEEEEREEQTAEELSDMTPGEAQDVIVTFSPVDEHPYLGTVEVETNDPDEQMTYVRLFGQGLHPPEIALPAALSEDLFTGGLAEQQFDVGNTGRSPLTWRLETRSPDPATVSYELTPPGVERKAADGGDTAPSDLPRAAADPANPFVYHAHHLRIWCTPRSPKNSTSPSACRSIIATISPKRGGAAGSRPEKTSASSRKIRPVVPSRKAIGTKTAITTSVVARTAKPTSRAPR